MVPTYLGVQSLHSLVCHLGHSKLNSCLFDPNFVFLWKMNFFWEYSINYIRSIKNVSSSFAWPSVVVYGGPTVIKDGTKVKCDWSDSFSVLLEKLGVDESVGSHRMKAFFFFFKPTYRPKVFLRFAR